MIRTKLFCLFLVSLFGQVYGSFPFDLDKIASEKEALPTILEKKVENMHGRPIGAHPGIPEPAALDASSGNTGSEKSINTVLDESSSSFDAPKIKKRRTAQVKMIAADMTVEEIIDLEVKERGFIKEEKRAQFRKTLQLIAQNDRTAFIADEVNFKAIFGKFYATFNEFYLLRFMIMFGADKLNNRQSKIQMSLNDNNYRFTEAFDYLLKTKPLNVLIEILIQTRFWFEEETLKNIVKTITEHYPELPFFKKMFIESLNSRYLSYYAKVFTEDDEKTAFNYIPEITWPALREPNMDFFEFKFQKAALHFPEYYLELSSSSKFIFISLCLKYDDLESFEKLIELDPRILTHSVNVREQSRTTDINVMHEAIYNYAARCIRFLCDIAPELIMASTTTMKPALRLAILNRDSKIYDIFYNLGYNEAFVINNSKGIDLNLIQYAFYAHSYAAIKYFIDKVGAEMVREEIKKVWKTIEQITIRAFSLKLNDDYNESFKTLIIVLFNI